MIGQVALVGNGPGKGLLGQHAFVEQQFADPFAAAVRAGQKVIDLLLRHDPLGHEDVPEPFSPVCKCHPIRAPISKIGR